MSFLINPYLFTYYTPRTEAFKNATGITDVVILEALNDFDLGLIANNLDSEIIVLYPIVGGDSTKHSYNFMDVNNYNLTYFGGVTHSSNGMVGNGINGYAETGFNPNTFGINQDNFSYGFYSRTAGTSPDQYEMGNYSVNNLMSALLCNFNGNMYNALNDGNYNTTAVTSGQGLFSLNRDVAGEKDSYHNGVLKQTHVINANGVNSVSFKILSVGNYYSARQCAFAYIGHGMSDAQHTTLYNLVQQLQTDLSRQV